MIAIKTIYTNSENTNKSKRSKQKLDKAEREFDLLYGIDHPNIMKAFLKWRTSKDQFKLALEYLPCRDLKKLVDKYHTVTGSRKLPIDLVRFYTVEMIKAISYMKLNKILHRDIKPENIMLDHHFHLKLADFGFSIKYDEKFCDSEQNRIYKKCSSTVKQRRVELLGKVE